MVKFQTLIARIAAVFGASAFAALAGGAVVGIDLWKAAVVAGFVAAGRVTQELLQAWYEDGILSRDEVARIFGKGKNDA